MHHLNIAQNILSSENVEPREFLRYCFGIDNLILEEVIEEEADFRYRSQCIDLFSKLLGIEKATIRKWGNNPNLEKMPQYARTTCGYAQLALSRRELDRAINQEFEAPILNAIEFIEETLLQGLSPSEKLKSATSSKFRSQCLTLLSNTLNIPKSTIYEWGSDMGLSHMPKHYQHTLAYALIACKKHSTAKQSAA